MTPIPPCRHCGHEGHIGQGCRAYLPQAILPMRCPCLVFPNDKADPKSMERLAEMTGAAR